MGRLEKIKGVDIGIHAFYELQKKMPAYYWILGQGREESNLKKLAEELGISHLIKFLGFQKNPYMFLKNADCFLLPSRSEGHPYTLMEAMCCGLPCVVSEYSSSVRDLIQDNENGMIAENKNFYSMAVAMELILNNGQIRDKFIENGKKTVEKYAVERILPEYNNLFLSFTKRIAE